MGSRGACDACDRWLARHCEVVVLRAGAGGCRCAEWEAFEVEHVEDVEDLTKLEAGLCARRGAGRARGQSDEQSARANTRLVLFLLYLLTVAGVLLMVYGSIPQGTGDGRGFALVAVGATAAD